MRKQIVITWMFLLIASNFVLAQVSSYSFTQGAGTFTALTATYTSHASGTTDNAVYNAIPIGFTFNFNCTNYTTVSISSNGFIVMGNTCSSSSLYTPLSSGSDQNVISALASDLQGLSTGSIRSKTSGSAPNRTFTVEWQHFEEYLGADDYSFQIILYETTNVIEIDYTAATTVASNFFQVGIGGTTKTDFNNRTKAAATSWLSSAAGAANTNEMETGGNAARNPQGKFTWTPTAGCSGTPTAGTITAPASVCSGVATNITLGGATSGCGISYQWQSSPTGGAPWTNVGTSSTTYSVNQTVATYYQCITTCSNSGLSATSPSVYITISAPSSCYCTSTSTSATSYFNAFSTTGGATNITNNTSGYSAGGYGNFTAMSCSQSQGNSINFSTTLVGTTVGVNIWVDWNQDGDFSDAGETVYSSGGYVSASSGSFTVPITALTGSTRMRIRMDYNNSNPTACGSITRGETEDYTFTVTAGTPMSYSSSTVTQASTAPVATGDVNREVICIQVVTTGAISPISLTNLVLRTNGSTNPVNDIQNAKIWYTGTSSTYATTTQFGSTYAPVPAIGTDFNITGSQTLATGTNYFWLTYDILGNATIGNVVDAVCNQITVAGSNYAPSVTNPAGTRLIDYCTSTSTSATSYFNSFSTTGGITNITNNSSGYSTNGYGNFTAMICSQMQTSSINFSTALTGTTVGVRIWVDWNRDGDFSDAGENVYASAGYVSAASGSFSVPLTATPGNTRMRIKMDYNNSTPTACGSITRGETEDYTFNVVALPACSGTPTAGTAGASPTPICPGLTSTLTLTGYTVASGITYQWQSSPDNATWTNISGATSTTYTTPALTTSTYYRCVVTCTNSGLSANSSSVQVVVTMLYSCYCTSSATSTLDMDITNVNFGTINNTSATVSLTGTQGTATGIAGRFSNWTASTVPVPSCMQGATIPFSVTIGGTAYSHRVMVYIDYNRDGDFLDAGESINVFSYANPTLPNTTSVSIVIPMTASIGTTLMRVVCVESSTASACGTYSYGETEDYYINITAAVPCAGTPTAGTAAASPTPICPDQTSTLSLTGYTVATGITFQWQSSPDNATWTNISGATSTTYQTPALTTSTYYRCIVTCTNSGVSANSSSVQVVVAMSYACYCASAATSTADEDITNVTFGSINNTSVCSSLTGTQGVATGTASLFSNFYNTVPAPSVMQGSTVPLSVTITQCGSYSYSHHVAVYIDFNRNGLLTDAGEQFIIFPYASSNTHTISTSIPIPLSATTGNTLMRIVCKESSTVDPCLVSSYGETEDYRINITAAAPCAGMPTAGTASASPNPVCPGSTTTLSVTGYTIATGITFQWQSAPAAGGPWTNISGATATTYTTPALSVTTYYRCVVTCTNSGSSANTASVQVVVGLNAACYCASSATSTGDMDITNVTFGTINNATACVNLTGTQGVATGTAGMYSRFAGSAVPIPNCERGILMPISVTINSCGTSYSHAVYVFIDFNQDGDFTDANEKTTIFAYANPGTHTINSTISIPSTATLGNTTMRILCVESSSFSNPCGTYTWGETEDYTINIIAGVTNMSYVSCTTTQNNTTSVGQGSANKEIICVEVVTSGMLNPLTLTGFRFRTDGTTNTTTDILNAKVYYTGNSGTFSPINQFGTTVVSPPAPGANMDIAGTQTLTGGKNYFWLTYDINTTATIGNVVDAQCLTVQVSGNQTPTVTNPAGTRPITAPLPPNDEPCGAIPLAISVGSPSFQTGTLPTTTTASPGIPAPGCSSLGPDVWFSAIVPASGRLIIDMDDASGITDMGMAWYTSTANDCNNIDVLVECDDDDSQNGAFPMICRSGSLCTVPGDCAQNGTLTPGTLVYVRVWEYGGGTAGDFLIGAYEPDDPGAPSTCANAEVVASLPFIGSNTTCCRQNTYGTSVGCGSLYQDGEDYLYKYTPAVNEVIDITLSGTNTYTGVFVTNDCPSSPTVSCIASQTSATGNPMLCGVSVTAGVTYYIMVDTDPGPPCTSFNITIGSSLTPTCNMNYSVSTTSYNWETYFGTNIVLPIDDRFCNAYIPIGFPSCFDGYQYTGLLVSSNGYLIFDPISCTTNLPGGNAAPNIYSGWSITAAIPNTTNAPRNSIMGPWHDIDPAQGGVITYGILGTAPNRRIIVTWANAPLYSGSCGQLSSQQIKIYETTNDIEVHIKEKVSCSAWNSGAAILGLHNYNGTNAVVPAGYNYPTQWSATNEAWKFTYSCSDCITPLPVDLVKFSGKNEGSVNKLWWSTSSEINNDYFVIEEFIDGEFREIGRVKGAGNSNSERKYEFYDDWVMNPTSYYKLKQVDFDGKFKHSDIVSINKPLTFKQNVYPNPAIDAVNVLLGYDVESASVIVRDLLGKEVKAMMLEINGASFIMDVTDLSNGMYTIQIYDFMGEEILKDKIVINRE